MSRISHCTMNMDVANGKFPYRSQDHPHHQQSHQPQFMDHTAQHIDEPKSFAEFDVMEVMDFDPDDNASFMTSDGETKCNLPSTNSNSMLYEDNAPSVAAEYDEDDNEDEAMVNCDLQDDEKTDRGTSDEDEVADSLAGIAWFGAGLDGHATACRYMRLQPMFDACPMGWVAAMNFVVQLHYDMIHPPLKPNIISLVHEYLAYMANAGHLNELFAVPSAAAPLTPTQWLDRIVRGHRLIRMALFVAVKYDQGFQMNVQRLFDPCAYAKPMLLCQTKQTYAQIAQLSCTHDGVDAPANTGVAGDAPADGDVEITIDELRVSEIEFCNRIQWKFSFSTRFQCLMAYLKRLGFDTSGVLSDHYKHIKMAFAQCQSLGVCFDENVKFGFLCRFLLEMTYYKPAFFAVSKNDLVVALIYSAYVIAFRWKERFDFLQILHTKVEDRRQPRRNGGEHRLIALLDGKHPYNDAVICELVKEIIRIGRAPNWCATGCNPIYVDNEHYHQCDCMVNCCCNTYLKYSKNAFMQISRIPCLSTSNVSKLMEYFEYEKDEKPQSVNQPISR